MRLVVRIGGSKQCAWNLKTRRKNFLHRFRYAVFVYSVFLRVLAKEIIIGFNVFGFGTCQASVTI